MPQHVVECANETIATLLHDVGVQDAGFPETAWAFIDEHSDVVIRAPTQAECSKAVASLQHAVAAQRQNLLEMRAAVTSG
jgi:hypothetical protein